MMKKSIFRILLLIAILAGLAGAYFVGYRQGAIRTFVAVMRELAQGFGPSHDYYLAMAGHADEKDIPVLLYGLKNMPDAKGLCCDGECIEALRRATGARPGDSYADWTNWWTTHRKEDLPEWHPAFRWDTNLSAYVKWSDDPTNHSNATREPAAGSRAVQ